MAKELTVLILLTSFLALKCQEQNIVQVLEEDEATNNGKPSYSFSYGVSDAQTGDIKAVWESKEGDTVKGHYSVLEPDGTMRSVEYTAGPKTGFTAVVNNDNGQPAVQDIGKMAEPKAMRDFEKFYDISEDMDDEEFYDRRSKRPFDFKEKEYPPRKRPKYPFDLEPSEYTHSITIKHPREDSELEAAHSHIGYSIDPNCKTKTKKESYGNEDNLYSNIDYDVNKMKYHQADTFREPYDKYAEPSNFEFEKIRPYGYSKFPKYEELKPASSMKYGYQSIPDVPSADKYYPEEMPPPRPKKKHRPSKVPDYSNDDLDDYILVPKKKYKPRIVEQSEYRPESDGYDRPYSSNYDEDDDRYHPVRGNTGNKEVIRKIVKKKRPVINLLDIFDI